MKFGFVIFGLLIGIVIGVTYGGIEREIAIGFVKERMVFFFLSLFILSSFILIVFIFQKSLTRVLFGVGADSVVNLFEQFYKLVSPSKDDRQPADEKIEALGRLSVALYASWSFRIWVFRAIIATLVAATGAFGTYVLIEQNSIIDQQTQILERQENLVKLQTQSSQLNILQQSSDQQNLFEPIVARIISELISGVNRFKSEDETTDQTDIQYSNILTDPAEQELLTILSLLKPYTFVETAEKRKNSSEKLEKDAAGGLDLVVQFLSPERGQIFRTMLAANIKIGWDEGDILDLRYADMRNVEIDLFGNDPEPDQCKNDEQNEMFYTLSETETRLDHVNFSGAQIRAIDMTVTNGEILDNAGMQFSRLRIRKGKTPPSLKGLILEQTELLIESGGLDFSGVMFQHSKAGCIKIVTHDDTEFDNIKSVLNGLTIRVDKTLHPDISDWKTFIFQRQITHNGFLSDEDYDLVEKSQPTDQNGYSEFTLQYQGN